MSPKHIILFNSVTYKKMRKIAVGDIMTRNLVYVSQLLVCTNAPKEWPRKNRLTFNSKRQKTNRNPYVKRCSLGDHKKAFYRSKKSQRFRYCNAQGRSHKTISRYLASLKENGETTTLGASQSYQRAKQSG